MLLLSLAAVALSRPPVPPGRPARTTATASMNAIASDSIRGRVADSTGTPVAGVHVTLVELARAATTDSRGGFVFGDVPAGRYTIVARRLGYAAASRVIRVTAGERQPVDIRLTRIATDIEPVVVTATRDATDVANSPLPVAQLSGDRLQREQSVSLSGAIDRMPGVHNLTTGQQIGKPVVRGLAGARVLVLDNGHRLEDYSWSDEDGPSIDARLAQRVEVIRGPASVLYGSDAIGGVINVIPAALPDASGGGFTRTQVELTGATNNREAGLVLGAEGARSRLGWRATAIARFAEDMNTPDGKLENTKYSAVTGEAAAAFHSARGTSTLRYARYGCECHLLEANEPPKPAGGEEEEEGPERKASDDRVQFTGNYVAGRFRFEPKLQWQRHSLAEMSDELGPGGAPTGVETEVFNLLLNTATADLMLHHGDDRKVHGTLGLTGEYQTSDSRGVIPLVPDARVAAGAAFAFEQIDLGQLSIVAGARGDTRSLHADANAELGVADQSRNVGAFAGDFGLILRPLRDVAVTANVGRAWRAPTLFELFANGPRLGEARYEIGDATLDPEKSLNLDGSIRWSSARAHAEIAAFSNRIDDFIYIAPTGEQQNNLPVYRYEHALATLTGGELSADFDPARMVTLRARYDMVRGTNEDTDGPIPLIPPPRTTLEAELHGVGLGWAEHAHAGVDVEINSEQTRLGPFDTATDGYTLLGIDAGIARHLGSYPVRFDIRVRNLTDKAYKSFLSRYKSFALDPGRNVLIRLSAEF
jgi:outer membrane receptor protein involved in Fe transport